LLGPFLARALITTPRRPATFWDRAIIAALAAAVAAGVLVVWDWWGWDRASVSGAARCALVGFAAVMAILVMLGLGVVVGEVSPGVALERDKKTVDALLSSRLSSGEIVLGLLAAGLVKSFVCLAVAVPLFIAFAFLGGVDLRLVLLGCAGLVSTVLFLGSVAIAASVSAPTAQRSLSLAMGLALAWLILPFLIVFVLPRVWPAGAPWVLPGALWWLDSTPLAVAANLVGMFRRCSLTGSVLRMIGLQAAGTAIVVAWATWQLRPAARALYDGEGRAALARLLRRRWGSRPPCGDDPVLWNEMHSTRGATAAELVTGHIIALLGFGFLVYLASWFALPAFAELSERGYSALPGKPAVPDLHPLARMMVNQFGNLSLDPAPGQARLEFNIVVRQASAVLVMLYVLVLAGLSSEAIAAEKERDTWLGLLATPLSGWEILRAKMQGALWRLRGFVLVLLGLWTVALLAGALHPLGLIAALAGLAATSWFYTALGVHVSLRSRDRRDASRVILLAMLPMTGLVLPFFPHGTGSVLLGSASMSFATWASLLSYEDIVAVTATGAFPQLASVRMDTGEGAWSVLAAVLIGVAGHAIGAALLTRAACRGFDAAVGRPQVGVEPPGAGRSHL
jgi:ABC-type transport system involved in multi-copper enzyme maturation permease subunit